MAKLTMSINGKEVGMISGECCYEFVLLASKFSMSLDDFFSYVIGREFDGAQFGICSLQDARAAFAEVERFRGERNDYD